MKVDLTKKDIKFLRLALQSAIQNEGSLIDAYSCQFCHGTKFFQDRPCPCKTGILKGSIKLVRYHENLISEFIKILQKITT